MQRWKRPSDLPIARVRRETVAYSPSTSKSMRFTFRGDPSRAVQIGFLLLLSLSSAQVAWWITENIEYSHRVEQRLGAQYREGAVREAEDPAEALAALAQERASRINRYLWEGGFFLLVLIGGMSVLTSAIRFDANLRRRQQNFIAAVSHEFKSPLASIRLAAETLALRSREPDTERLAKRILADDERLLRMVENLLDSARLEQGRHVMKPAIVDLAEAINGVTEGLRDRAAAHEVAIEVKIPRSLSLRVDPTALDAMLRNLVDNALKSCVAASGHRIVVDARHSAGQIELAVHDDGLGFAPEEATRIFKKFYRIGDELRRNTQGTGLGLYIVQQLARLAGARITASSPGPRLGATMTLIWSDSYLA